MAIEKNKIDFEKQTINEKLRGLYILQKIDSKIDSINLIKGELPLEVRDIEDEITGLNTRMTNLINQIEVAKSLIHSSEEAKKESQTLIEKYSEQIKNIKNNREFESLTRELEFQNLEIELKDLNISKYKNEMENNKLLITELKTKISEKTQDLTQRKGELNTILGENKHEEQTLTAERNILIKEIEPRLLYAYSRIRSNVINKIAVAHIEREACSGCNSKIPPQRQIEIKSNRKIITCEFCGRIIVDAEAFENEQK
ncbi:MAG: C4-type zinc ribbon domain-containing protein [Bacteroidales bacterium]|jgi:predicted  nucleic acid-binding Zn-ribbon protein|nr:C4-type zinc ribbon domain-containing protein [Bacteroidales bacterium]